MRALVSTQSRAVCSQAARTAAVTCTFRGSILRAQRTFVASKLPQVHITVTCKCFMPLHLHSSKHLWQDLISPLWNVLQVSTRAKELFHCESEACWRRTRSLRPATDRGARCVTMGSATNGGAAGDPKLAALREKMAAADGGAGVAAYIIPSEDPHMERPPCRPRTNGLNS